MRNEERAVLDKCSKYKRPSLYNQHPVEGIHPLIMLNSIQCKDD
jgi:hypothetical protein